jgi:RNA polymerase sigma-70 factor, ECF subfamily
MDREQFFKEAISENSQRIFRICSYFFQDDDDRNDAYQETLIRVWENLRTFQGRSLFSTWMYRVTVNTCLSHIRSDKKRKSLIENSRDLASMDVKDPGGEDHTDLNERKIKFFRKFLAELGIADRTLVSLYLEDISTRVMSEITGFSESAVRVRIHRLKERVKNEWEEKQHGTG